MKRCSTCHETKPETEFWRRRRNSPGLSPRCKACSKAANWAYRHRDLAEHNRRQREHYRLRRLAGWRPTPRTPEQVARYTSSNTQFYRDHPARQLAKAVIRESVKRGERIIGDASLIRRISATILLKCPYCPTCGTPTPPRSLHGHHHRGYDKQLDVLFVCGNCHAAIGAMEREAVVEQLPPLAGLARFIREKREMAMKRLPISETESVSEYDDEQTQEVRNAS